MYNHILVPLDGSELSERVLPHALDVAKRFGADVHLLHTVTPMTQLIAQTAPGIPDAGPLASEVALEAVDAQHAAEVGSSRTYLEGIASRFSAEGIKVQWEVDAESPAAAILAYAKAHQIDMIAMSTHGRGGIGRFIRGSVTDEVLRHCQIPMLLIHPQHL